MAGGAVLFLVVGPSGVGKDTLIDAAREALRDDPEFVFARRAITRPVEAGGEAHEAIDEGDFEAALARGEFMAAWGAHGLRYGIRTDVLDALRAGRNVVVNGSRGAVRTFADAWPQTVVLSISASPELVEARLKARGREDAADVAARLARAVPIEGAPRVIGIANDGAPQEGAARFMSALLGAARLPLRLKRAPLEVAGEALCLVHETALVVRAQRLRGLGAVDVVAGGRRVRARLALATDPHLVDRQSAALSPAALARLGAEEGVEVAIERARPAESRDVLAQKVAGAELSPSAMERVMRDIVDGRYSEGEIAGFLVAAAQNLSLAEVVALTRVRAALGEPLRFDAALVADKHSMGGVPGSRITLIAVPIVASHGIVVPKTSSRAITSAAGTADVMECAARVDLSREELMRVVGEAGAAIAWNGRISHSPLDDVMNAINRPLRIRSAALDVSSILSKKLLAGASHVVVDIPAGAGAKVCGPADGAALARLFEAVGRGVGLHVEARVTDGSQPIGRAVGPALELGDVEAVLAGAPDAPAALREKALDFAAVMLAWDPAVPAGRARARAEELLDSGAAAAAFEAIVAAQGQHDRCRPGLFSRTFTAPRTGVVRAIDGYGLAGLARAAGAPFDKGAGTRVLAGVGAHVAAGAPVLEVVASSQAGLDGTAGLDALTLVEIG